MVARRAHNPEAGRSNRPPATVEARAVLGSFLVRKTVLLARSRMCDKRASMPFRDRDRQRAYGRAWMKRNPEKAREAMRRWRATHPGEHAHETRSYYLNHREERLAQSSRYHKDNPHVGRVRSENYRARKHAADGAFTTEEWLVLIATYGGRCAYCGAAGPLEADHRIPLTRGGLESDREHPPCLSLMQWTQASDDRRRVPRASRFRSS